MVVHLFPQIDPEMMSDGKEMKRHRKYLGIRKNEKESSIPRKRMSPKFNMTKTNVCSIYFRFFLRSVRKKSSKILSFNFFYINEI